MGLQWGKHFKQVTKFDYSSEELTVVCRIFVPGSGMDKQENARPLSVSRWECWLYFSALDSWDALGGFCKCPVGWHFDGCFLKLFSLDLLKCLYKKRPFLDILLSVLSIER